MKTSGPSRQWSPIVMRPVEAPAHKIGVLANLRVGADVMRSAFASETLGAMVEPGPMVNRRRGRTCEYP